MSKELTEEDIIRVMREEYDLKLKRLREHVDLTFKAKVDGEEKSLISPELKILHKTSGIRYTVDSVAPEDVILRTPEGEKFIVDRQELEKEYEIE
jgi:hypothetical protein